ncbi:GNAT family N-acetyltransferase (plasmid) [Ensifer sp. D2-11]
MPDIESDPYRIASIGEADLKLLQTWLADEQLARGLNIAARRYSEEEVRRYASSFDGENSILVGIYTFDPRTLIGIATFDANPRHRTASWTLVIGDRRHRKEAGVMGVCVTLFDWVFTAAKLEKISSRIAAHKLVLIHLLERVGVPREGYLRSEILSADGLRRHDEVLHGLLRSEWPEVRRAAMERRAMALLRERER